MEWNNLNKSFSLNDNSFKSVNELITFSESISEDVFCFLKEWFNSDDFIVVATSGSTGIPKKITLKKKHVINSAKATGEVFDLKRNTSALLCLPVKYIAGKLMLVRAIILGWKLDYINPTSNPLKNITRFYDFSAMTPMQVKSSISKIESIKKLIIGGGKIPFSLENELKKINTEIFETYGMTETITHIAIKPVNGLILNPVYFKTLQNINIYKDKRDCLVIEAPKISDEFIFTNDVINLISPTEFEVLGRYDNVINSGGIKLQPELIEKKLSQLISNRFFLFGIPDSYLGEKLVLFIEGNDFILDFNEVFLKKYEIPKNVYFLKKFEETETGKINRKSTVSNFFQSIL